jgi:hypothetical protein
MGDGRRAWDEADVVIAASEAGIRVLEARVPVRPFDGARLTVEEGAACHPQPQQLLPR